MRESVNHWGVIVLGCLASACTPGTSSTTNPEGEGGQGGAAAGEVGTGGAAGDGGAPGGGGAPGSGGSGSSARATAISVGQSFACALMDDETIRCWGGGLYASVRDETGGQPGEIAMVAQAVPGLSGVASFSAGSRSVCAVLDTGKVSCWGGNTHGEAGQDPLILTVNVPTEVPALSDIALVACGNSFACALGEDGTAQCWGTHNNGVLGDGGGRTGVAQPGSGSVVGVTDATSLATSLDRACALSEGQVHCWGEGANADRTFSSTPVLVTGLTGAKALALGRTYSCAVTADDGLSCWGVPPDTFEETLTPTPVEGLSGVRSASGSPYGLFACAALLDGKVRCWGRNGDGQLGNGTIEDSSIPVEVTGIDTARAIGVGDGFACALLEDGGVQCWGRNFNGELGDGTTTASPVPVQVQL